MIELRGLKEEVKNEDIYEILCLHYNQLIIKITGYVGALTDIANNKNDMWSDNFVTNVRNQITPDFIEGKDNQIELIKSTFNKLYSKKMEKTTANENYVLARGVSFGILNEEYGIQLLVNMKDKESLKNWLKHYQIDSIQDRAKVMSYIKALNEDQPTFYRNYLEKIGGDFESYILEHWHGSPIIEYENPNAAILFMFSKDELSLISAIQPK